MNNMQSIYRTPVVSCIALIAILICSVAFLGCPTAEEMVDDVMQPTTPTTPEIPTPPAETITPETPEPPETGTPPPSSDTPPASTEDDGETGGEETPPNPSEIPPPPSPGDIPPPPSGN